MANCLLTNCNVCCCCCCATVLLECGWSYHHELSFMMCQMIIICMFMGTVGMLHAGNEPENWHYVFLHAPISGQWFPTQDFLLPPAHSHHCIL